MFEGKKVAFIASGGGGRGVAHGGVLRACEDMGIKFDLLIGASAGAICVAFYSQYGDSDTVIDLFRRGLDKKYSRTFSWRNMISFKNFFSNRIKTGLIDLQGAEEYFAKTLEINDFRRLPIPTYISVTNLTSGMGEMFGPGYKDHIPISTAVVASSCVPIIFRPVEIEGSFYIDGEIKRPTAVNAAFELGADAVIISDIYKPHISGIEATSMLNIAGQMANMLLQDKSMRGIKIASARFPNKDIVLISPDVGQLSAFSTQPWEQLENLGYNAAIKELANYARKPKTLVPPPK